MCLCVCVWGGGLSAHQQDYFTIIPNLYRLLLRSLVAFGKSKAPCAEGQWEESALRLFSKPLVLLLAEAMPMTRPSHYSTRDRF